MAEDSHFLRWVGLWSRSRLVVELRHRIWPIVAVIATILTVVVSVSVVLSWLDEPAPDELLAGLSVEEVRKRNQVRQMFETEQGLHLSHLSGIYGYVDPVNAIWLLRPPGLFRSRLDPRVHRGENLSGSEVEIHKTADGKIMALVYLTEADAGKLSSAERGGVEVFAFFEADDDHPVLVGLPQSRVQDARYQYYNFAPVVIE